MLRPAGVRRFLRYASVEVGRRSKQDPEIYLRQEQRILEACHPYQRAFVLDDAKRIAALTGGRCGKTTAGLARLARVCRRTPRARTLFIAETKDHAEELIWSKLKDLVERLGCECRFNETKLICTFIDNGAQIKLVGADDKKQIGKLRGVPRHEVGIDEGASYSKRLLNELINQVLGPRLGDYDGVLWIIGTPGKILDGLFYDITRIGSTFSRRYDERDKPEYEGWQGWSLHTWAKPDAAKYVPVIANAWRNDQFEKKRNHWADDNPQWMREYLGLWAADDTENVFKYQPHDEDGNPFNQWAPEINPATRFAHLPDGDWVYIYGIDLGHSDPLAVVVLAHNPLTNQLRHVFEYEQTEKYVRQIAEVLVGPEWCERITRGEPGGQAGGLIGLTGWPLGMPCDATNLGGAIIEELRQVYGIPVEKADQRNKHDAIELVNGDLNDGRLKIIKGSKLETQILNLQWAVDDVGRLKEHKGQANHLTDALVYARQKAMHLVGTPPPPPPDSSSGAPPPPTPYRPVAAEQDDFGFDLADPYFDDFDDY